MLIDVTALKILLNTNFAVVRTDLHLKSIVDQRIHEYGRTNLLSLRLMYQQQ